MPAKKDQPNANLDKEFDAGRRSISQTIAGLGARPALVAAMRSARPGVLTNVTQDHWDEARGILKGKGIDADADIAEMRGE